MYSKATTKLQDPNRDTRMTHSIFKLAETVDSVFLWTVAAECLCLFQDQLLEDMKRLEAHESDKSSKDASLRLSLAAKWAPRER
jgi:hypothetical protein